MRINNNFLTTVVLILLILCNKQQIQKPLYLLDNPNGIKTSSGAIEFSSPLLLLDHFESDSSKKWVRALVPNRKVVFVKPNLSNLFPVQIENGSLDAFAVNPDDESFAENSDSTLKLTPPLLLCEATKKRFPAGHTEMMLWDTSRYYPMMKVIGKAGSGYINSAELQLSEDKTDSASYFGLILPPFIRSSFDSNAVQLSKQVNKAYRFTGDSLFETAPQKNIGGVNALICKPSSYRNELHTIYSTDNNTVWLFEYGDSNIIEVTFDEEYPQSTMEFSTVDIKGNGHPFWVVQLGHIYGDGVYCDFLFIPGCIDSTDFTLKRYDYYGNSGEGDVSENVQSTWYVKKENQYEKLMIKKTYEDGNIKEFDVMETTRLGK